MITVLLADDHTMVREGLRYILEAAGDIRIIALASNGEEAVRQARNHCPEVVVMDVSMPGLGGAAATKRLRINHPKLKILAFSGFEDEACVRQLLAAGANGYVLKRRVAQEVAHAIRVVAEGGTYLDPLIAGKVTASPKTPSHKDDALGLSEREETVLRLTARGFTNKETASMLGVSIKTIETYKTRLSRKLSLHSRADMVRYALGRGWLQGEIAQN